jgi:hypothetical protein
MRFQLRNRVITHLEEAEVETDPERRRHLLSFAVIGGGFSGIEVAGEIYDLLTASRRFYASIKKEDIRVVVIHGLKQILPELPESLGAYAHRRMQARGIEFGEPCQRQRTPRSPRVTSKRREFTPPGVSLFPEFPQKFASISLSRQSLTVVAKTADSVTVALGCPRFRLRTLSFSS